LKKCRTRRRNQSFNILDLIRCKFHHIITDNGVNYYVIPANPATGLLYVTEKNHGFVSGHIRMRGKNGGQYPYNYLEMIDTIFGKDDNTIEVCSVDIKGIVSKSILILKRILTW